MTQVLDVGSTPINLCMAFSHLEWLLSSLVIFQCSLTNTATQTKLYSASKSYRT
jgi:hypothetical protein